MPVDVYRQAASVLVLREKDHSILLLKKPRKRDTWQLPQGGIEAGESATQAVLRELKEETSLEDCRVIGMSKKVYQYDFPASYRRFRPDHVKGQRIQYVFALVPENAQVTVDGKEIEDHVWVKNSELSKYIRRRQYLDLVKGLCEEAMRRLKEQKSEDRGKDENERKKT